MMFSFFYWVIKYFGILLIIALNCMPSYSYLPLFKCKKILLTILNHLHVDDLNINHALEVWRPFTLIQLKDILRKVFLVLEHGIWSSMQQKHNKINTALNKIAAVSFWKTEMNFKYPQSRIALSIFSQT